MDCFLLDNNGFIILSENPEHVSQSELIYGKKDLTLTYWGTDSTFILLFVSSKLGEFFGEIDGTLMRELVINEGDSKPGERRGVYEKVELFDYQGICDIYRRSSSSATSIFIDVSHQFHELREFWDYYIMILDYLCDVWLAFQPVKKLFSSALGLMNELAM